MKRGVYAFLITRERSGMAAVSAAKMDWEHGASRRRVPAGLPADVDALLATARALYRIRRTRDRVFGADAEVFRDPAWDIMLDLYASMLSGKATSASSAALAACIPGTTALRCIEHLIDRGLINRFPDPTDGRRTLVELTPAGMDLMTRTLAVEAGNLARG